MTFNQIEKAVNQSGKYLSITGKRIFKDLSKYNDLIQETKQAADNEPIITEDIEIEDIESFLNTEYDKKYRASLELRKFEQIYNTLYARLLPIIPEGLKKAVEDVKKEDSSFCKKNIEPQIVKCEKLREQLETEEKKLEVLHSERNRYSTIINLINNISDNIEQAINNLTPTGNKNITVIDVQSEWKRQKQIAQQRQKINAMTEEYNLAQAQSKRPLVQ